MKSAECLVPASICMACSSVEGASTLSEARFVGLYQYIFLSSFPKRTLLQMYLLLKALKHMPRGWEVLLILHLTVSQTAIVGPPRSSPAYPSPSLEETLAARALYLDALGGLLYCSSLHPHL